MFTKKTPNDIALEEAIASALVDLSGHTAETEEHAKIVKQLTELNAMSTKTKQISPDALLTVGGHLLGIILITKHEQMNVITTKAMNFVLKLR